MILLTQQKRITYITVFLLGTLLSLLSPGFSQEMKAGNSAAANNVAIEETTLSLNQIRGNLDGVNQKRAEVIEELKVVDDPEQKESLEFTLSQLDQQKRNFERMFEKTALGGLEVELYDVSDNEEEEILHYDWQKELIKIVQPVFSSLQNLTESQRKRDFIRTTRSELQQNLVAIDDALEHLNEIDESQLSEASIKQLDKIKNSWELKRTYYANQLDLINLQYRELEKEGTFAERVSQGAWNFISNQGKTLLFSLGAFFGLLYIFSWILRKLVQRHEKKLQAHRQHRKTSLAWRLMLLLYEIFSFIIAFTAMLVILHSSGDMVLFGFAILIILAMIISFRNSVPAYFKRLRTFLNMGLAREGERVIYQGIPWEIEHINLYSVYLINPLLDNGRIRLTIDCLENMISREVAHSEAFYPTMAGDTVIIDGVYAKIVRQTPETIYLDNYGSAIEYDTADFVNRKPKNISVGYLASTKFILDYSHYGDDIDQIIEILKSAAEAEVTKDSELADKVTSIGANYQGFNIYGDLVFGMSMGMSAGAEGSYYAVPRLLQRAALTVAREKGWRLPRKNVALEND
ncbi:hypothetical protein WMO13_06415 [Ignatzschineria larvae DSM 13226]|uniref:Uncharacterized protein n=1 Tax=Ignatzschineria larvae DSM 13226 TaxID=1111732 RepID=A0ABZ3BWW8_9GAMM|nr:hypothetical protein [Ignatzschineria larvae]